MVSPPKYAAKQPLLIQLLLERGFIEESRLSDIQPLIASNDETLEEALTISGVVSDVDIAQTYADYMDLPVCGMGNPLRIDADMARRIGQKFCCDYMLIPLATKGDAVEVAFANPTDLGSLEQLQMLTGKVVTPLVAPVGRITEAIDEVLGSRDLVKEIIQETVIRSRSSSKKNDDDDEVDQVIDLDHAVPKGQDSQVVRLVNHILASSISNGASDIHLETFEETAKIRIRIDGKLHELSPPPKAMYVPMISRLKVLAKMDIAERRIPQDGAIALVHEEKRVDLRVSTVPTVYGEKMVMRILAKGEIPTDLTQLGFTRKQADSFVEAAESPHGLLLVTGPTGSGKSTTLYSVLNLLKKPDVNIMTVEDPVEYKFEGLNQVHVRSNVGLTFASALRAFLRQDPDIIMVGEVRDQETAQICLRAALTGHMVLSTLHTNDALAAVNRLTDMGVEPFLLGSALRLVEAQRLVRRLCSCKEAYELDGQTADRWDLSTDHAYYRPRGCDVCRGTGYKGRVGLFEVVGITPTLRDMVIQGAPLPELRAAARDQGYTLLADAGLAKVKEGLTSLEEALTVCAAESEK
jgi:type IV pilus assembly protein PilB